MLPVSPAPNVRARGGGPKRDITIGATDDATGRLQHFTNADWTDTAAWVEHIRASSALPGLFESVRRRLGKAITSVGRHVKCGL